jgi:hypothetical protein
MWKIYFFTVKIYDSVVSYGSCLFYIATRFYANGWSNSTSDSSILLRCFFFHGKRIKWTHAYRFCLSVRPHVSTATCETISFKSRCGTMILRDYFNFVLYRSTFRRISNLHVSIFTEETPHDGWPRQASNSVNCCHDNWRHHHTGSELSPPFHECPSASCKCLNGKPAPEVQASIIAPTRNFISVATLWFPSNQSADSMGHSFEYQTSFGSTAFDMGAKWPDRVLAMAIDVSISSLIWNRRSAYPTSSFSVPFFWLYVCVCVSTAFVYFLHFVFLLSSFLLMSLFHYFFIRFFVSIYLPPLPSLLLCLLSVS